MAQYRILIDANDEKGLVYKVSTIFFEKKLNILTNNEFVDKVNGKFFMRSVVEGDVEASELKILIEKAMPNGTNVNVIEPAKKNIVIMATKEMHALGDILIRHEEGELEANILGVISNYDELKSLVS
ncbi:MAG: formyltetrahydrofolate deformylase, partial [Thiovulaceae bacterium]|nr:formyltetrahydrofolate deformylase [Sulfurimonadaceae bacterium]